MSASVLEVQNSPFAERTDIPSFHVTTERTNVLSALREYVRNGSGIALLVGGAGVGKTTLIRALLRNLEVNDRTVVLNWPASSGRDLVREVCKRFGVGLSFSHDRARTLRRLRKHFERSRRNRRRPLLILDQAENLSPHHWAQFEEIVSLIEVNPDLVRLIVSGQPVIKTTLEQSSFARTRRAITVEHSLSRMTAAEMRDYLHFRLQSGGPVDVFTDQAVEQIFAASGGNPRAVDRFAHTAIMSKTSMRTSESLKHEQSRPDSYRDQGADLRVIQDQPFPERCASDDHSVTGSGRSRTRERLDEDLNAKREKESSLYTKTGCLDSTNLLQRDDIRSASDVRSAFGVFGVQHHSLEERMLESKYETIGQVGRTRMSALKDMDSTPSELNSMSETRGILERLEQAVARGERLASTLEAFGLDQVGLLERTSVLRDKGEQVVEQLSTAVGGAGNVVGRLEQHFEILSAKAEERINRLASRLSQMFDAMAHSETMHRARETCDRAVEIEGRLKASADQLADQAEEIQDRFGRMLSGVEAAQTARQELESTIDRSKNLQSDFECATKKQSARLIDSEKANEQARQKAREEGESQVQALRRKASTVVAEFEQRIERLNSRSDEALKKVEGVERELAAPMIERLNRAVSEKSHEIRELLAQEQTHTQEFAERSTKLHDSAVEVMDKLHSQVLGAEKQTKQIDEVVLRAASVRAAMDAAVQNGQAEFAQAAKEAEKLRSKWLDDLRVAMHDSRSSLEQASESVKTKLAKLQAQTEQDAAELIERSVATLQRKVEEQLAATQRTTEEAFDAHRKQIQGKLDELSIRTAEADVVLAESHRTVEDFLGAAERRVKQLAEQTTTEVDTLQHYANTLSGRHDQLRFKLTELMEQTERSTVSVDDRRARIVEVCTTLESLFDRTQTAKNALLESTRHTEELVNGTNATCGRVEEMHRSVTAALMDLGGAFERVQPVREQIEKVDQLVTSLTERAAANDRQVSELSNLLNDAKQWRETLQQLVASAEDKVSRLDSHHAAAAQTMRHLSETTSRGQKLVSEAIEAGQRAEEAASAAHEASRIHGELVASTAAALEQSREVQHLMTEAECLIGKHRELLRECETIVETMALQLEDGRGTLAAGEHLRHEFTTQAEDLRKRMTDWQRKCADVEQRVGDAVAKPQEIIATAQAQAAQLEKVCGVVRKVFAGLSQSSLEAVEKTREFRQSSDEATERLSLLSTETQRASATLQEWVAEAIRVRERLEQTIKDAPSVSVTHPGDALVRMSQTLQSKSSSIPGRLHTLPEPPVIKSASALQRSLKPATKEEQVSAILEDAKKAVGART